MVIFKYIYTSKIIKAFILLTNWHVSLNLESVTCINTKFLIFEPVDLFAFSLFLLFYVMSLFPCELNRIYTADSQERYKHPFDLIELRW